jgi:lysophospholipase L1-like esterase
MEIKVNEKLQKMVLEDKNDGKRWLFVGNSIIDGCYHTFGKLNFSGLFRERVVWECRRVSDVVVNSAFGGGMVTARVIREFPERVALFKPHVAFLLLGANDAMSKVPLETFTENMRKLADMFQEIGCYLVLMNGLPAWGGAGFPNKEFAMASCQVAAEKGTGILDNYSIWENDTRLPYLMSDSLHPNAYGHLKIAHDMFRYMGIWEDNSTICRLDCGLGL